MLAVLSGPAQHFLTNSYLFTCFSLTQSRCVNASRIFLLKIIVNIRILQLRFLQLPSCTFQISSIIAAESLVKACPFNCMHFSTDGKHTKDCRGRPKQYCVCSGGISAFGDNNRSSALCLTTTLLLSNHHQACSIYGQIICFVLNAIVTRSIQLFSCIEIRSSPYGQPQPRRNHLEVLDA